MKKIYLLGLLFVIITTNAQTTITEWNFNNATPATAMLPTTGSGTFTIIGGVVDNTTTGVMPGGNPTATGNLAYSIKTFPAAGTASGTAGFQFLVSTVGISDQINVSFDPRGSGTSSKWQRYEYTTDGATWITLSSNAGALVNSFTTTPMITLTFPAVCSNKANFGFRIVSIFDPLGTDYASVAGGTTAYSGTGGTWRIDNVRFSNGVLSIAKNNISGLSIYPNPVTGKTFNVTSANNGDMSVVIYDVIGKQVLNTKVINNTVNIANLNAGIYIVKITEEGKTATRKLVIQ